MLHRVILLHTAKSAGTAVQSFLRGFYNPSRVIIRAEAGRPSNFSMIRQMITETDFISGHICFDEANELRGTADFRLAITLREPLSRTLSNLRYYLRLPRESLNGEFLDIRDRLERERFEEYLPALRSQLEIHNFCNLQTRFLLDFRDASRPLDRRDLAVAKKRLEQIDYLFLADRLSECARVFCVEANQPVREQLPSNNTVTPRDKLPGAAKDTISEDLWYALLRVNELDAELWDFACELLDKRIEKCGHPPEGASTSDAAELKMSTPPVKLSLTEGSARSVRMSGFDFSLFDFAAGVPLPFPVGTLAGPGAAFVAWMTEESSSIRIQVQIEKPFIVRVTVAAAVTPDHLRALKIRLNEIEIDHACRRENGHEVLEFAVRRPLDEVRIQFQTLPPKRIDTEEEHPGLGRWIDLPAVSLAISEITFLPL